MISDRRPGGGWASRLVAVAANGAFQTTLTGVRVPLDVVAYTLGNGRRDGAGAYTRVTGAPARRRG